MLINFYNHKPLTKSILFFSILFFFCSCTPNKIIDEYKTFHEAKWSEDSLVKFDFEVVNKNDSISIYIITRYNLGFPYYNLFVNYTLKDSQKKVIKTNLKEIFLSDSESGMPLGKGFSDIYTQEILIEKRLFLLKGNYSIILNHKMREPSIQGIESIGVIVNR